MNAKFLEIAITSAVKAGNTLLHHYSDVLDSTIKESLRDVVTKVDKLAEQEIVSELMRTFPDIPILTEESGFIGTARTSVLNGDEAGKNLSQYWVVDALDGTVNYVNHIPFFCVSIALIQNQKAVVGVIYNPMLNDLYFGTIETGAFKNQNKLCIKDKPPEESLFAVSFSGKGFRGEGTEGFAGRKSDTMQRQEEFLAFGAVNDSSRGCLRTGCAAMNLAYLAEGRLGGCWGKANKHWDIAAGLLLAELAGAKVQFSLIETTKHLAHYLAATPQTFEYLEQKTKAVLSY